MIKMGQATPHLNYGVRVQGSPSAASSLRANFHNREGRCVVCSISLVSAQTFPRQATQLEIGHVHVHKSPDVLIILVGTRRNLDASLVPLREGSYCACIPDSCLLEN